MTDQSTALTNDSRDALRARIEAAERRNAERTLADDARDAAKAAADYTRANPLAVIGGAVAVGLVIGLLTQPGRRAAKQVVNRASDAVSGATSSATSGIKSITARGGSRIGTMFGEAVLAYVMTLIDEAMETARAGQDRAGELGDAAGAQARKIKTGAVQAAEAAADNSKTLARKTRDQAERVVNDLRRKTKG